MQYGEASYSLHRSYYYTLKSIRPGIQRLTFLKMKVRQKGWEVPIKRSPKSAKGDNVDKLENNLSRAKSMVRDLAMCNDWDWWCTLTISKDKHDRSDLKAYRKAFYKWVFNMNKRQVRAGLPKIQYLLVPEKHKDGMWHMHGFLKGVQGVEKNGFGYLDWSEYQAKFGYISLAPIKNQSKASNYIVKYMTKDVQKSVTEMGEHLYVASKGLKRPKIIKTGVPFSERYPADWDNKYCSIAMLTTDESRSKADSIISWDRE